MAASEDTIRRLADILRKRVTKDQLERICDDLELVPGNQSFRETVEALLRELRR